MKWYNSIEEKKKKLRKKYCRGICSKYYIRTGRPQIIRERVEAADEYVKQHKKEYEKSEKKAKAAAMKAYKKDCRKRGKEPLKDILFY